MSELRELPQDELVGRRRAMTRKLRELRSGSWPFPPTGHILNARRLICLEIQRRAMADIRARRQEEKNVSN